MKYDKNIGSFSDLAIIDASAYYSFDQLCSGSLYGYPNDLRIPFKATTKPGRKNNALLLEKQGWISGSM